MNTIKRKNFSLVWGRKLFFGVGWPILCLIGLGAVLASGLPENFSSLSILLLQVIAQAGMLILLSYFVVFYPAVYLVPTYYFSRMWGTGILVLLMAFYSLDGLSYALHGVHLNFFIIQHLILQAKFLEWKAYLAMIPFVIIAIFLWVRGNHIWKLMQARFMNTNRRWYLWFIIFTFFGTQFINIYHQIHHSKYVREVLEQFPINLPIPEWEVLIRLSNRDEKKDLNYPRAMTCSAKKNFVFVIYQQAPELLNQLAPQGIEFKNHYVAKKAPQDALDNLLYSFPEGLRSSSIKKAQIIKVFRDYDYHVEYFTTNAEIRIDGLNEHRKIVEVKNWLKTYVESSTTNPFALFMYVDQNRIYEKTINHLITQLEGAKLIEDTVLVFTALEGEVHNDLVKVPLLFLWEGQEKRAITRMTSHYDVMPTLIQESMGCEENERTYSFGTNLFVENPLNYFVYTKKEEPYVWITKEDIGFSLKDLDYFSDKINSSEILQLRKDYYNFLSDSF